MFQLIPKGGVCVWGGSWKLILLTLLKIDIYNDVSFGLHNKC